MAINQNDYHYWEGSFQGLLPNEILELSDGEVVKDYNNKNNEKIDYKIDNTFYLKDFK